MGRRGGLSGMQRMAGRNRIRGIARGGGGGGGGGYGWVWVLFFAIILSKCIGR